MSQPVIDPHGHRGTELEQRRQPKELYSEPPSLVAIDGDSEPPLFDLLPDSLDRRKPKFRTPDFPIWTERKGLLVAEYLRLFIYVTHHGTYIDGFAGQQDEANEESWCARLVLRNAPNRGELRHFHLFEISELPAARLRRMVKDEQRERDVNVYQGNFNQEVDRVLRPSVLKQSEATFALLDQRCFECEWATVEKLAAYKAPHKIELLYFMPEGWLDRSMKSAKREEKLEQIDRWWGRRDWDVLGRVTGPARAEIFRKRFEEELGYAHVDAWQIFDRTEKRTMYYLIHAADHDEAPKFMRRAYRKCVLPPGKRDQLGFRI